jgi:putative heme-binding domain-containing protein
LLIPDNWSHYTPRVKEAIVSTLASRPALVEELFTAIAGGVVKTAEISPLWRQRLVKLIAQRTDAVALSASRVLQGGDRMAVYRKYRDALALAPHVSHGHEVFTRVCSACHSYGGVGGNVGPDLTGIRNQTADTVLLHLLVPNYEIAPGYETILIKTRDGRTVSGWITGETGNGVSLRTAVGGEETILRKDIGSLESSAVSLMPEGLEQLMSQQEIADLISYLKSG